MSLGLTPREFVQQVFYVQEKVLLDFFPDDDVYKEVLTEANLVLQELQKEEDWLWLRETANLGFIVGRPPFEKPTKDLHWRMFQHDFSLQLPDWVYKPSELYGDCVRLCRYRIRHERLEPMIKQMLGYKKHWQEVMDTKRIKPDRSFIYYGEIEEPEVDVTDFEYGGSFPFSLNELKYHDLPKFIQKGKWYVDIEGYLFVGDKETKSEDPDAIFDTETPYVIYMCNSVPVDPIEPEMPPEPFDEKFLEPAPHGFLEAWRYWHRCWYWCPYPKLPDNLVILWDSSMVNIWNFVEVFENDYIKVPFASAGSMYHRNIRQTSYTLQPNVREFDLGAVVLGNKLTFTRPLNPIEMHRVVLMDCQKRIEPFHICDEECSSRLAELAHKPIRPEYPDNPCDIVWDQTQKKMLTEVPDPNYVVYRTAALHAQGSPPAQGIIIELKDNAQKLLSAMRQNNAEATTPDFIDWQPIDFINIV